MRFIQCPSFVSQPPADATASRVVREVAALGHLVAIGLATIGVDLFCAVIAFLLERHSTQTEIKTFGGALFWTSTQLLTVSSNIKNPISAGGRVLDVFMEIYAITVIAMLAGAFGSFLQKRGQEIESAAHA